MFAVDGGGTKTEAALFAGGGAQIGRGQAGPCNLYQDAEAGLAAVMQAWRECCRTAGLDPAALPARTSISAAAAGTTAPPGRDRFFAATSAFAGAFLSSDAYAALLGAFDGGPGVLLSVGTGTVACRIGPAGFEQRGGWGFPAGDRGGGAWLGLQAVTAWLEHRDGLRVDRTEDAALWAAAGQLAGSERAAILAWLRAAGPADYARLAPAVLQAAADGSARAEALVDEAAGHLARLVRSLSPAGELALSGGLAPGFAGRLAARLDCLILPAPASPLRGAWLVGAGRAAPQYQAPGSTSPARV